MQTQRNPNCYALSEDTWMAVLNRRNGNSISVTIPRAVIQSLGLRPGMRVKLNVKRMPPLPPQEDAPEEAAE